MGHLYAVANANTASSTEPSTLVNSTSYNARGQVTGITSPDNTRSWTYTYDVLDRLTAATNTGTSSESRSFAYDDAGNLTFNSGLCAGSPSSPNILYPAQGVASGHPHGPTSICGTAVTYDADGNMTAYDPDGAAGPISARSLAYDLENRPVSLTQNGNTALSSFRSTHVIVLRPQTGRFPGGPSPSRFN